MSLVKFECPGCGQNMECERACSGDVIHCPRCCAQIRIPFRSPGEMEGSVLRAELVTPAASAATAHDGAPAQAKPSQEATAKIDCPACHAELKVAIPAEGAPKITVLRKPPAPAAPASKPAEKEPEKGKGEHPDFAHMTIEERERQIASAREAHPVQVYSTVKPRLEYVLSDKAAPVKEKPKEEERKSDGPEGDGEKTVTE